MIEVKGKRVVVTAMEQGERQYGKIVLRDDNGTRHGIRERWCQVFKVGSEVTTIEEGQWILVEHGRWSLQFSEFDDDGKPIDLWVVDYPKGVVAVSDEKPEDYWNIGKE